MTKLADAARPFVDGFTYDPGHSDLDNEQPITVRVTLGDWRRLHSALRTEPEAATIIGIDVATSAVRDAARYRWLRDAENHDNPVWRFLSLKGYDEKRMDALIDDELAKERHLPQPHEGAFHPGEQSVVPYVHPAAGDEQGGKK